MNINDRIKNRRLELGLTLKDLADKLGVAESTVSRYESSNIKNMGMSWSKIISILVKYYRVISINFYHKVAIKWQRKNKKP